MKDYEKDIILFVYKFKIVLSTDLKYCDYETINKKFITFLPFFDCEKIYKLMIFGNEIFKLRFPKPLSSENKILWV